MVPRRLSAISFFVVALVLPKPGSAGETVAVAPEEILASVEQCIRDGKVEAGLLLLEPLFERVELPSATRARVSYLAALLWFAVDRRAEARDFLERYLAEDPEAEIDPELTRPGFAELLEDVRAVVAPPPPPAAIAASGPRQPPAELDVEAPPDATGCGVVGCFLPLGIAQGLNGELTKGIVLGGIEAVLGITSLVLFAVRTGDRRDGMVFDLSRSQALLVAQDVAGFSFYAALIYGVVDAFLNRPSPAPEAAAAGAGAGGRGW